MTTETIIQNRLGQSLRLAVLDRNSTKVAGCIGFEDPDGPIAGFAEIDPNGMFAGSDECDRLAVEVVRRWNSHDDLLNFAKYVLAFSEGIGDVFMAERARDLIAKAELLPKVAS